MSRTLLLPCAGLSKRYPDMRPKWMLTTPDGHLAVAKAAASVASADVQRIVVGILKEHDERYGGVEALRREFLGSVDVVVLDEPTRGPAETVRLMIERAKVSGAMCVKDTDSFFAPLPVPTESFVAIGDLRQLPNLTRVGQKSFVVLNEQGLISEIVEKDVVSNLVSVGLYGFRDVGIFNRHYDRVVHELGVNEIFVSHVIFEAISEGEVFVPYQTKELVDVGTVEEWRRYCERRKTIVLDLDGVVFENHSKFFRPYWDEEDRPIDANVERLRELQADGAQLVFMTARPESYRAKTSETLERLGLRVHALVMGCQHGPRYLVNDFAKSNPYPSARSINLERNTDKLREFI